MNVFACFLYLVYVPKHIIYTGEKKCRITFKHLAEGKTFRNKMFSHYSIYIVFYFGNFTLLLYMF